MLHLKIKEYVMNMSVFLIIMNEFFHHSNNKSETKDDH